MKYWFNGVPYASEPAPDEGGFQYWFNGLPVPAIADVTVLAYLRPTGVDVAGGWTDNTGGLALDDALDETVQNDADYIRSSLSPVDDICRINLGAVDAVIDGTKSVRVGYAIAGAGITFTVRLKQSTTLITAWSHSGLTSVPTLFTQTLTSEERTAIDWESPDTLKLEFEADS